MSERSYIGLRHRAMAMRCARAPNNYSQPKAPMKMKTVALSRMVRNVHPFQIKDPVTGKTFLARFLPPAQDIEDRLAAWEIIPMPALEESTAQAA